MSEQTGRMLGAELSGLIRDGVDPQSVDEKIAAINTNLDAAIVIVPEFSVAALGAIAAAVGVVAVLGRSRLLNR